jgi:hypothetical protein
VAQRVAALLRRQHVAQQVVLAIATVGPVRGRAAVQGDDVLLRLVRLLLLLLLEQERLVEVWGGRLRRGRQQGRCGRLRCGATMRHDDRKELDVLEA